MAELHSELLKQRNPWAGNQNTIWLASNIALRRNIEKFKFPGKMHVDKRKQIIEILSAEMSKCTFLEGVQVLKAEDLSPLEKEFLVEHYLSYESFQGAHQGEAFMIDKTGEMLSSLNIRDHLHIQEIDITGNIESAWSRLVKIEGQMGEAIRWSFSSQFGFLTADPFECGTGLTATLFLQLSALIHTGKLAPLLENLKDETIHLKHFLGHTEAFIGDMIVVSNNFCLGFNEETILSSLRSFSSKLIQAERQERQAIAQAESADIKDKVARSYGVLVHSYQIEAQEALNAIASLKLGRDLNWIKGIEINSLNELFFNCRRAHLLSRSLEKISQGDIPHKRAEFIHHSLKGVELLV